MRRARGFTMIELAVVVSLLAIVIPSIYVMARSLETQHRKVLAQIEAARGMRSFSEALRRDLWTMRFAEGTDLVLAGRGACEKVTYRVSEGADGLGVLVREGVGKCGPAQALARGVAKVSRTPLGVEVVFASRVGANETLETRLKMGLAPEVPK